MEVLECIRKRRAIKYYTDKPVPDDILEKILEAGRWAPGAAGFSAFEFLVVRNEESRRKILELAYEVAMITGSISSTWCRHIGIDKTQRAHHAPGEAFYSTGGGLSEKTRPEQHWKAPVYVIVVADQDKRETHVYHTGCFGWEHILSAACAIQNMWLAAYSLGVGATWLTFYDPVRIQYMFGIPSALDVVGIVLLGYPPEWPEEPTGRFCGTRGIYPRRPLEDMVHYEKYDMEKRRKFLEIDPFISWLSYEERKRRVKEGGGIWPDD